VGASGAETRLAVIPLGSELSPPEQIAGATTHLDTLKELADTER
jgi:hypothetical protein